MRFVKFQYTDLKNKVSNREVLVVQEPNTKLSGIDVTELEPEQQAAFAVQFEAIKEVYLSQLRALQESFDLKHNFRQFFPEKMEVVEQDEL